ncbi:interleukin-4 receptor subunit alpha isoform X2 [Macrotis lagotis]|uniref:interleukin-4 receptor subunit alpha isoform X2 n=1 Tax=Macrotis lagotis TaxID=92651 RepID=UPI003D6996F7
MGLPLFAPVFALWCLFLLWPGWPMKPKTPRDIVLSQGPEKDVFILTWNNNYSSYSLLIDELKYTVEIKKKDSTTPGIIWKDLTEPKLTILANELENKSYYIARVKTNVPEYYNGTSSDWGCTVEWYNEYELPFWKRLEMGVPIFCIIILLINLLCYFGVIKIKKVWWDQIPNPAHSHLTAIIIQNHQLSTWRKLPNAKERKNFLHWKTCLSKLFPCLLSHNSAGKEEDNHLSFPSKKENSSLETQRAVLVPEKTSVVQLVELYEAEVESEKGDADDVSFSPSPEDSASSFIQNKEALADKFVQMLFLDLIGEETLIPCSSKPSGKYKDLADTTKSPLKENKEPTHCWDSPARLNDAHISERSETVCQSPCIDPASPMARQPSEPHEEQWQLPPVSQTQGNGSALDLSNVCISELPQVVDDNPAYRSFSSLLTQSLPKTEEESSLPLGPSNFSWEQKTTCHGDPVLQHEVSCSEHAKTSSSHDSELFSLFQSQGENWEEMLRQRIFSQGDVTCPTMLATSGYRCFDNAVKQGNDQNYKVANFNVPKESGYRSFASLLNDSRKETSLETSGDESEFGKGKEGYRPLENLISSSQKAVEVTQLPLFTFGMDLGETLPQKHQHSPIPSSFLKMYSPQEMLEEKKGKYSQSLGWDGTKKGEDTPEESSGSSKLDFSSGIVYSTLTCHLCGHLKRCPSPDGNYTPLGNAQSTKCNCMVEILEALPHPLIKATISSSERMESPERKVPRTSSVEFLGENYLKEDTSPGICVSLLPQDCEYPFDSTSEKWKGSLHLKPNPGDGLSPNQSFSPNVADCEHEGNTYIKVS